jgi:hypothetical protein
MSNSLVNNFTWQLGDTGFVLNDDDITGAFVDITDVKGFDSAPARQTKRDHEGADGGFMDAEFETGRDISLAGTVFFNGESVQDTLDALKANWAVSADLIPLYYIADGVARFLSVKPLGCVYDLDVGIRVGMTPITFSAYAEDPRIYTDSLAAVPFSIGAIIYTGFAFNLGFPFGFGGFSDTSDGAFVTNGGNRSTPTRMYIYGPVTNPVIYNDTVNKQMGFTCTLVTGDVLVVDTQYRTVTLNGSANRRSFLTLPGWFDLEPGDNFIRFRAEAGTGSLALQYREAWR